MICPIDEIQPAGSFCFVTGQDLSFYFTKQSLLLWRHLINISLKLKKISGQSMHAIKIKSYNIYISNLEYEMSQPYGQ